MQQPPYIISARELKIGYRKGKEQHALGAPLNFGLRKSKLTCLLGPNGVGKSTLIKTIMGQLPPLSGEVTFDGQPLHHYSSKEIAQKISAVLTDKVVSSNLTVEELVGLGRTPFTNWLGKMTSIDKTIVREAMIATKTHYLSTQLLSEISDGQLQKAMIARALAQDGELIILDEPTAHLDLINRFEIMQLLRHITMEKQKSILVITHDLDIAIETADELWLMQCGEPLISGSPEDLIISGKINALLPSNVLAFDPAIGKIRSVKKDIPLRLEGPNHLQQWIELALAKNNLLPASNTIIQVDPNTLMVKLIQNDASREFGSISDLITFLSSQPDIKN